jgi:HK97 family phage major capsid protein
MTEFPALKEAQGKLDSARKALFDVMKESQATGKGYDMDAIKSVPGSAADKLAFIRTKNEEITALKKEVDSLGAVAAAADNVKDYAPESKGADEGDRETKGSGNAFTDLSGLMVKSKAWAQKGQTAHVDFEVKTLFQTTAGWTPETTRSGLVTLKPMVSAPSVVDHLTTIPVSQAAYKYMEETTYTSAAQETGEGGTYQEAVLALTERSQVVQKVAVWIPVTDEQLEDEPGARAYVEARLQNMMRQRMDLQVLAGTGDTTGVSASGGTQLLGTRQQGGYPDSVRRAPTPSWTRPTSSSPRSARTASPTRRLRSAAPPRGRTLRC